jgi:hypothetical protein
MRLRVSQYAHVHSTDFEFTRRGDGKEFDRIINVCVERATRALDTPAQGYSKLQCDHIGDIFRSTRATHRTIRRLLDYDGPIDPETVDTLALARLQLECLYAICMMLEDPKYVTHYMQDYWKKRYVQYLLDKEETKNLVRFQARFDSGDALQPLMNLANIFGITQGQIMTVDLESSLGCHWRPGPRKKTYHHFPLQGGRLRR